MELPYINQIILACAVTVFAIELWAVFIIVRGGRRLGDLKNISPLPHLNGPLVSIIVPACNEAATIAPALITLLNQDYARCEVIVVNDRSLDDTGKILREIQCQHPQLVVLDIDELPKGWLGKHNAMHRGAALAKGDILLFTDADIHMHPSTVSRAVHCLEQSRLDHLCLIFKNMAKGWLLNCLILDAGCGLLLLFRPWCAGNPRSPRFMGVGAFNMVRHQAYRQVGGHGAIKMHPIDDIMLGKIIKEAGLRQECLLAYDFITVSWYRSTFAMIGGLMKNVFAQGLAQFFFLMTISLRLLLLGQAARHTGLPPWLALAALITPYITVYIILKAVFITLKNNGISWRGSHYSLAELRRENRSLL